MVARLSTVVLAAAMAGGLALTGAVAAPAGAGTLASPAEGARAVAAAAPAATSKARMVVSKKRIKTTTIPFRLKTTSRTPVLKGSTAKNRALVAKHVKKLMAEERKLVAGWWAKCDAPETAEIIVTKVSTAVYKKRYASVTMAFDSYGGCPLLMEDIGRYYSARSFTLDLKTGKKVKLSKFVATSAVVTRASVLTAVVEQNPNCLYDQYVGGQDGSTWEKLPAPSAWNVSSKGVHVWFNRYDVGHGGCALVSALIPWTDVASPAQLKGKRTSRVYVRDVKKEAGSYTGEIVVLTVQGRLVARVTGWLPAEAYCTRGVRTGKQVRAFVPFSWVRTDYRLAGTTKKPALKLGEGWRRATATEVAAYKKGGFEVDAIKHCNY